ncbi:MAG: hypothetical protein CMO34_03990 [Verrucomicrobia bacterium]|nr:hypothetical protein [Verrucomicrobiota bacterium]
MTQSIQQINRLIVKRSVKDFCFISAGVVMAAIGLKAFLLPNDILDGGAMGVSLLIHLLTDVRLSILIVLVNLPFMFLGARQFSKTFAIKSSMAILLLAVLVYFVQFPPVTTDRLLIAVFGGFFLGAGIGLTIRGGAVIDGTEVLALTIGKRSSLTVGDFIAIFNVLLFGVAVALVDVETAMYSMLTYLAASKTVDFILNGIEEYIGIMVVSDEYTELKEAISLKMGRGVTVFKSNSAFDTNKHVLADREILYCVVTRLEVTRVMLEIDKIDPKAFVIQQAIKDTKGGMIKKRAMQ